jgi:hypothetical protein
MTRTRSAVTLRECDNVVKKLKRDKIPKQGLHQRSKIFALRRGQKRALQWRFQKTVCRGFSHVKINAKKAHFLIL